MKSRFALVSFALVLSAVSVGCAAAPPPVVAAPRVDPCYAEAKAFVGKEELAMISLTCEELNKHGVPNAVKGWYVEHCR